MFCCNVCFFFKFLDNCFDGWKEFEGFCYKFDLDKKGFFIEVEVVCCEMKVEFFVVNLKEEN